jgi:hypothetical protein
MDGEGRLQMVPVYPVDHAGRGDAVIEPGLSVDFILKLPCN